MIHRCKGNRISSSPKGDKHGKFEKSLGHCTKGFKVEPDESKRYFYRYFQSESDLITDRVKE